MTPVHRRFNRVAILCEVFLDIFLMPNNDLYTLFGAGTTVIYVEQLCMEA